MEQDAWSVYEWHREIYQPTFPRWDLCIVALGKVAPVGLWHEQNPYQWEDCIHSNILLPIRLLRTMWPQHRENATVCFMAGSNPQMIMSGYSAYNISKMALLKAVEQLDFETPDAKLFALGPGIVLTKIHNATLNSKWDNPKLSQAMLEGKSTPIEKIYECLKWAIAQPKAVIGGRNLCVSDPWDNELAARLGTHPNVYKLRRVE